MKKIAILVLSIMTINLSLSAQKNDIITVKAGNHILDYFPTEIRYRYPEFLSGKVYFSGGTVNTAKLNYNILAGEMEFIQARDTLYLARKKEMKVIVIAKDTFFFDNGYLELESGGPVKICKKQYYKLKEVLKKDSYGTSSSGAASTQYGSMPANGKFYKLVPNEDLVFQKISEYYMSASKGDFVECKKKTILQLFPEHSDEIKNYLKSNEVDFNSENDLVKLVSFIGRLKN